MFLPCRASRRTAARREITSTLGNAHPPIGSAPWRSRATLRRPINGCLPFTKRAGPASLASVRCGAGWNTCQLSRRRASTPGSRIGQAHVIPLMVRFASVSAGVSPGAQAARFRHMAGRDQVRQLHLLDCRLDRGIADKSFQYVSSTAIGADRTVPAPRVVLSPRQSLGQGVVFVALPPPASQCPGLRQLLIRAPGSKISAHSTWATSHRALRKQPS